MYKLQLNKPVITRMHFFTSILLLTSVSWYFFLQTVKVKLKQGLKIAMSISGEGNAYLQVTLELLHSLFLFLTPRILFILF
jgi:hypothetical protein